MCRSRIRDIPEYIQPYFDEVSQFHHYREYERGIGLKRNIEDKFICLKGFSSSTPIFNSAAFGRECLGGGFYFRFRGYGIVVDPGIGFVSLMHRNNIFINDIDAVIVTHSHLDHNCDVGAISALLHDYNSNKQRERSFFEKFLECGVDEPHNITWYMDEETEQSTQYILDAKDVHLLSECCDGKSIELCEDIRLYAVRTKHIKGNDKTYGIKLCFGSDAVNNKWGYTSDTCYFDELGDFFEGVSVLLFNISDIYPSDVEGRKSKRSHLGFDGSVTLLKRVIPEIALASEFCCTNGDYRYEIVKALRKVTGTCVYPSDPGFMMDIDKKFIRCSLCGKNIPPDDIRITRPEKEFGKIQYICSSCLL